MKLKEPKFMKDLRKVRSEMAKEWKSKSGSEIVNSIRRQAEIGRMHTGAKKSVTHDSVKSFMKSTHGEGG